MQLLELINIFIIPLLIFDVNGQLMMRLQHETYSVQNIKHFRLKKKLRINSLPIYCIVGVNQMKNKRNLTMYIDEKKK